MAHVPAKKPAAKKTERHPTGEAAGYIIIRTGLILMGKPLAFNYSRGRWSGKNIVIRQIRKNAQDKVCDILQRILARVLRKMTIFKMEKDCKAYAGVKNFYQ